MNVVSRSLAYHEAGHACMALSRGHAVTAATICENGNRSGYVRMQYRKLNSREHRLHDDLLFAVAGPVAEKIACGTLGTEPDEGYSEAFAMFAAGGRRSFADAAVRRRLMEYWGRAEAILRRPEVWRAVRQVARALMNRGRLSGGEVERIYRHAAFDKNSMRYSS